MKSKIRLIGISAIIIAVLFWLAEKIFYGDIDADGVLQESFFLPLSFLVGAIGILLLVVSLFTSAQKQS
jgi:DMSO/TMAO reductase YedYZ heme-binding membrane subunit